MRILVIGDSCIDKFIYCDINRLCPEAPVPILQPVSTTTNPGMASNVAANLESLGVEVDMITNDNLIEKTRYVDIKSGQMVMRLDENDECERCDAYVVGYETVGYDAIIISDYNKGFLTEEDIEAFTERAECPVFLDTKKFLGDWCKDIDFIKINSSEHEKNFEKLPKYPKLKDKMIVTKGRYGCKYKEEIYPTEEVKVSDVSGAGDTFMAGLVYKYIYGINVMKQHDISLAINFANKCASKVVQERGVTIIT